MSDTKAILERLKKDRSNPVRPVKPIPESAARKAKTWTVSVCGGACGACR